MSRTAAQLRPRSEHGHYGPYRTKESDRNPKRRQRTLIPPLVLGLHPLEQTAADAVGLGVSKQRGRL